MAELFAKTRHSVTHLEMRDTYGTSSLGYQAWRKGVPIEEIARYDYLKPWVELVAGHVARGVSFRRARIISEPVSDYIRYEYGITPAANLVAGERVRWLPRPQARDIALPGCDFWQFDGGLVRFVFQDGDGEKVGNDLSDDPAVAELCSSAFEAVWSRALDHQEYKPA
ncbi:DUF6879 family protein [Bailinhaonella thermotolerans]|uniref:DUF6879 domain-containing protein n=1 Tax=Bailinhaonella thermotolerans TaxID=1070861 RepID=A0A3A4BVL1_9ACTN|nr:DUF6879 family protein [Bailinhaonella thermotolerans]RJL35638.1 hypothetical protein D5H75_02290 [Bailinhaonella thermotolerans]